MLRTLPFSQESSENCFEVTPHPQTRCHVLVNCSPNLPCVGGVTVAQLPTDLTPPYLQHHQKIPPSEPAPRPHSREQQQAPETFNPAHLKHEAAHAEDHAEEIHVVRRRVVQSWVALAGRRLIPATGSRVRSHQIPPGLTPGLGPRPQPETPCHDLLDCSPQHFVGSPWVGHIVGGHSECRPLRTSFPATTPASGVRMKGGF